MGDYAQEAPLVAGAIARGELTAITSFKRKKKFSMVNLLQYFNNACGFISRLIFKRSHPYVFYPIALDICNFILH